jgi:RNA polymerase sigma-70 factor (ECF subfamily)
MQTLKCAGRQLPDTDTLDGILVQQALSGDQEAFAILVDRYRAPIFRLISHFFLEDDSLADDILQQVFLQLYLSLPSIRTNVSLKPWLLQVARHRCVDELRRKQPILFSLLDLAEGELSPLAALPDPGPLPEELIEQREVQQDLQRAIQALPARFRSVVLLRYVAQLSFSEIAQKLGIPEATAKTYFHRARPLLHALLEPELYAAPV